MEGWRDSIITTICKGMGSKADYGNYCPITLLSVPGKVFEYVLAAHIKPLLLRFADHSTQASLQGVVSPTPFWLSGFSPRPTRNLSGLCGAALWKFLEGIGTPAVIMDLSRNLHTHTTLLSSPQSSQLPPECAESSWFFFACLLPTSSAVRSIG